MREMTAAVPYLRIQTSRIKERNVSSAPHTDSAGIVICCHTNSTKVNANYRVAKKVFVTVLSLWWREVSADQ